MARDNKQTQLLMKRVASTALIIWKAAIKIMF